MPIIGITGGIASGKSKFCRQLIDLLGGKAELFDADSCAHELLAHDAGIRCRVTSEIHAEAYGSDGLVNRSLLRETVFRDPKKKRRLEDLLHPRIRKFWLEQGRAVSETGRYFVVDIPLLFETSAESFFDRILTVTCSQATQWQRLIQGRNLQAETAEQIIASQMPWKEKVIRSHHVVWNDGSFQVLHAQVALFAQKLHDRYG